MRAAVITLAMLFVLDAVADDAAETPAEETKTLSGMSILGNDEAPTSLVIVPWKASEIGSSTGLSNVLDAGTEPVDRDVFLRELSYYEIRSTDRSEE